MAVKADYREHREQTAVIQWIRRNHPEVFFFAIPNGGRRGLGEALRLKAEGVVPGVPDICVAAARGGFHGLYLEMKRPCGGTVSPAQKDALSRLDAAGYRTEVCRGAEAAIGVLKEYFDDTRDR
ncbi:MAG: VRR-NUC domain-containing protein [Deltaproteobacteria bacterium]|jgi:hypothetical protein|nr:VRR-NUC domain-containing protein [Deltaproteobacteria bacterium]